MKKPKGRNVIVTQEAEDEVPVEILAKSLVKIADAFQKIKKAGLNERALVLLIHDASGVGKPAVRDVLLSLDRLKEIYCSKRA